LLFLSTPFRQTIFVSQLLREASDPWFFKVAERVKNVLVNNSLKRKENGRRYHNKKAGESGKTY
jgi:hypothetical protein